MNNPELLTRGKLALLTISLSLAIFMNVLDIAIANVAIPTLAGNLAVSATDGTWVITSFAVSQAIMLPITGWLARRFGEVRLFIISTALFTLASVLCGLSINLPMLVVFRVIQGAVSGPMIPLSHSILLANYPAHKKSFATSIWAMTAVVGPIFGPILGGWITDQYTWPWIFYINVPVGIFSVILTTILLANRETAITKLPIDVIGLLLLIIGIGCLQVLLDKGNDLDWFHSDFIVTLAVISFIALSFLIIWEWTERYPVIDLRLFKERNFLIGVSVLTCGFMVYFSNVVIFPLWLQTQMNYTPTWAGLAAAPVGILPFLLSPLVGYYVDRFDLRFVVSIGFVIFAFTSFWQSHFYSAVGFHQLVAPRLLQGLGITFFFIPLMSIVTSKLSSERIATALGVANFCRILGSSFATSISITLWDRREAFHHSHLVEQVNNYNSVSDDAVNQLHTIGFNQMASFEQLNNFITNQAYMLSTNDIFWLSGWIFISMITVIWIAKPPFNAKGKAIVGE